ncbi:MAG TPA: hypothetical protein VM597_33965 [Gemmataceae bacterium]|jgi:hypothetical protein|nr:hypothetical protein [Gemmataceae bacterium]
MDTTTNRRTFLAARGFAAGVAGCTATGDPLAREADGVLHRQGVAEVFPTADGIQVAYPRPSAAVPSLVVGDGRGSIPAAEVEVLDQQPDHVRFRSKRDGGLTALSWRAEGPPAAAARGGR